MATTLCFPVLPLTRHSIKFPNVPTIFTFVLTKITVYFVALYVFSKNTISAVTAERATHSLQRTSISMGLHLPPFDILRSAFIYTLKWILVTCTVMITKACNFRILSYISRSSYGIMNVNIATVLTSTPTVLTIIFLMCSQMLSLNFHPTNQMLYCSAKTTFICIIAAFHYNKLATTFGLEMLFYISQLTLPLAPLLNIRAPNTKLLYFTDLFLVEDMFESWRTTVGADFLGIRTKPLCEAGVAEMLPAAFREASFPQNLGTDAADVLGRDLVYKFIIVSSTLGLCLPEESNNKLNDVAGLVYLHNLLLD